MYKKLRNIFFLFIIGAFFVSITNYYFSDLNIQKTRKNRSFFLENIKEKYKNLPLLKNDTENIIEYTNDVEMYKKNKKYNLFWKLIGK
tara:strand:- start:171 stop:434 length:264 start_codon:yes stop_codon:yes gene_type:complete